MHGSWGGGRCCIKRPQQAMWLHLTSPGESVRQRVSQRSLGVRDVAPLVEQGAPPDVGPFKKEMQDRLIHPSIDPSIDPSIHPSIMCNSWMSMQLWESEDGASRSTPATLGERETWEEAVESWGLIYCISTEVETGLDDKGCHPLLPSLFGHDQGWGASGNTVPS